MENVQLLLGNGMYKRLVTIVVAALFLFLATGMSPAAATYVVDNSNMTVTAADVPLSYADKIGVYYPEPGGTTYLVIGSSDGYFTLASESAAGQYNYQWGVNLGGDSLGDMVVSPTGRVYASALNGGVICCFDIQDSGNIFSMGTENLRPDALALDPASGIIYVGYAGGSGISGYNAATGEKVSQFPTSGYVHALNVYNGNLVFGEYDSVTDVTSIKSCDIASGAVSDVWDSSSGALLDITEVPGGYSGSRCVLDTTLHPSTNGMFCLTSPGYRYTFTSGSSYDACGYIPAYNSGSGGYFGYALGRDGTLAFYDLTTLAQSGMVTGIGSAPLDIMFTPDGTTAYAIDASTLYKLSYSGVPVPEQEYTLDVTLSGEPVGGLDLGVKGKATLVAKVYKNGVLDKKMTKKVKWSSSDKKTVSVSKGKIKALKAGSATITAAVSSLGLSREVYVTVLP